MRCWRNHEPLLQGYDFFRCLAAWSSLSSPVSNPHPPSLHPPQLSSLAIFLPPTTSKQLRRPGQSRGRTGVFMCLFLALQSSRRPCDLYDTITRQSKSTNVQRASRLVTDESEKVRDKKKMSRAKWKRTAGSRLLWPGSDAAAPFAPDAKIESLVVVSASKAQGFIVC